MHTNPMTTPRQVPNVICAEAQPLSATSDGLGDPASSEAGPSADGLGEDEAGEGDFAGERDFVGVGAFVGVCAFLGGGGGAFFVTFSMPGGITALLICKTEMLNGCASTDLMKEAVRPEPGTPDPSLISPPDLETVTLMNPCWLVAMPVDWKRVVRRMDLLLESFSSFSMS